jgi:uncharacterized BrkB/YihY/UPF0761 family membrane protein
MVVVIGVGLFIGAVGATGLYMAFRSFGSDKPRDLRGPIWIGALLVFIIIGCIVLLRLSLLRR